MNQNQIKPSNKRMANSLKLVVEKLVKLMCYVNLLEEGIFFFGADFLDFNYIFKTLFYLIPRNQKKIKVLCMNRLIQTTFWHQHMPYLK